MGNSASKDDSKYSLELFEKQEGTISLPEKHLLLKLRYECDNKSEPGSIEEGESVEVKTTIVKDINICQRLISILKNIPKMLDDEEIRYNLLLNGFEPGERSTLGSRPNDAIADLERIVNHAYILHKLDKLIENAKIRDPGQAIKDELDKIKEEYIKKYTLSRYENYMEPPTCEA